MGRPIGFQAAKPLAPVGPVTQGLAPINVAAVGDSLMWGQGLARNARFSELFLQGVGKALNNPVHLVWDSSRSGAKIVATRAERDAFIDTYPGLFPRGKGVPADFRTGETSRQRWRYMEKFPHPFLPLWGRPQCWEKTQSRRTSI